MPIRFAHPRSNGLTSADARCTEISFMSWYRLRIFGAAFQNPFFSSTRYEGREAVQSLATQQTPPEAWEPFPSGLRNDREGLGLA